MARDAFVEAVVAGFGVDPFAKPVDDREIEDMMRECHGAHLAAAQSRLF